MGGALDLVAAWRRSRRRPARGEEAVVDDAGVGCSRAASRIGSPTSPQVVGDHAAVGGRAGALAQLDRVAELAQGRRRARSACSSSGIGAAISSTGFDESAITTKRSAAAATIFSRVWAPPPPLTSQPSGAIWSAPSIAMSSRSSRLERLDRDARARAPARSVATEVATQRIARGRAPRARAAGGRRSSRCRGRPASRPRPAPRRPRRRAASRLVVSRSRPGSKRMRWRPAARPRR